MFQDGLESGIVRSLRLIILIGGRVAGKESIRKDRKMRVSVKTVLLEDLETEIQTAKDAGMRILAVSPAEMKKTSRAVKDFTVTSFILVTQ